MALIHRQVLCSTVGADDRTNASMSAAQLAWLANTRLIPELLEKLGHASGNDALRNAASVLVAIARAPLAATLARSFLAPEFLQKLLESAFVPTVSVQVCPTPQRPATLFAPYFYVQDHGYPTECAVHQAPSMG